MSAKSDLLRTISEQLGPVPSEVFAAIDAYGAEAAARGCAEERKRIEAMLAPTIRSALAADGDQTKEGGANGGV